MDDLISRQAAIDALWKALYEYEDKTEKQFIDSEELDVADWIQHRNFVQKMSDIDRQTILGLPSAQQWIPCSERLPKEGKEVLISTNGSIYTAEFDLIEGNVQWYDTVEYRRLIGVDAWMPLPEPYKERKEE